MIDEPKLTRESNDWKPLTGKEALKLWALVAAISALSCGSMWGVAHFVFGWL